MENDLAAGKSLDLVMSGMPKEGKRTQKNRGEYKMKIGDEVILLTPGIVREFDEFGNVVVQWGDGLISYYQENELKVLSGDVCQKSIG